MRKSFGLSIFLLGLVALTCVWEYTTAGAVRFLLPDNISNLLTFVGLFGVFGLGQAFVIVTGGIDLSVGSLAALVGVCATMLLNKGAGYSPAIVLPGVLLLCILTGVYHGLLVTRMRIQPFVVTLCGLFAYRGIARVIAGDFSQGFGLAFPRLKWLGRGNLWQLVAGLEHTAPPETLWHNILYCLPAPFLILLALAAAAGAYLHLSPQGRYLFAIGANEEGARLSGIRTNWHKALAYVLCSLLSGIGALLMAFKVNSIQANDFGSFYELYAIAGAVLGGCSLRGGSGNVLGVLIGAAIIRVLYNMVNILGIPSQLVYVVIGGAILVGVCADELFTRRGSMRTRPAW